MYECVGGGSWKYKKVDKQSRTDFKEIREGINKKLMEGKGQESRRGHFGKEEWNHLTRDRQENGRNKKDVLIRSSKNDIYWLKYNENYF